MCFDFAAINALSPGNCSETAAGSGNASEAYDQQKRTRQQTGRLCMDAGYRFWPLVFKTHAGMSKAATEAIRTISEAVADRERREMASVRQEFRSRVAVLMARSSVRSIRKLERLRRGGRPPWTDAVDSALRAAEDDLAAVL